MKYLVLILMLAIASTSFATPPQSGNGKILTLQSAYGGWIFTIDHTNNNPDQCNKSTMILEPSHGQYKEIYSLLLTAYTTGKPVTVFTNGCDPNGYNKLSMIYTSWGS